MAALVLEDLPVPGRAGYCTYNRAFVEALVAGGWETHVVVIGPRLPAPVFDPAALVGLPTVRFHVRGAHLAFGCFWVTEPRAAIRAWFHVLMRLLPVRVRAWLGARRQARVRSDGAAPIGRMADAEDASRVGSVLDRVRPAVVLIDTIFRVPAIPADRTGFGRVLVAHDVFFKRCASLEAAGLAPRPMVTRELERSLLTGLDRIVAISDQDAGELRGLGRTIPVTTLHSPIEPANVSASAPEGPTHILYLGSAAHHNVDGLRWFLAEIWPTVATACPEMTLDVVGSVGESLAEVPTGVRIHGRVDRIDAIASTASFAVNPVRAGSGLKIKMLDYFAHGLPCVTTTVGAEGFPASAESPIAVGDSAADFAEHVIGWARDPASLVRLRLAAHRYATHFSSASFKQGLDGILSVPSD